MQSNPASTATAAPWRYSLGDPGDVVVGRGPGHRTARAEPPGRSQRRRTVRTRVGHRPGMADLRGDRGPGIVDRLGEPTESGQGLLAQQHAVAIGPTLGRHRQIGHGGHAHAPRGHPSMELDQLVGDLTSGGRPFEGGRLDDPVLQRDRAQPGRLEHRRGTESLAVDRLASGCRHHRCSPIADSSS